MAGVFISYRRNDSDIAAGRLAEDLSDIFGHNAIFRDIDTLEAGEDYTRALDRALESCGALLAVIGPRWTDITDPSGQRRLEDSEDWVRMEIKRALARGIRVIPVLISAQMPKESDLPHDLKPLIKRQAIELSDRHWKKDIELLSQALEKVPDIDRRHAPAAGKATGVGRRRALTAIGALFILTAAAGLGWWFLKGEPSHGPVDLSQWVRIRNSGPEGSVAGLAVVTAMEARLAQQKRPVTLSARYIYEKAKSLDRFGPTTEGTDMTAALYVAETYGAPPEDRWPYMAGSRDLPDGVTWDVLDRAAGRFRARVFRLSGHEDIRQQLDQGLPVLAQVRVTDGWMSEESGKTGMIRLGSNESFLGAHAVVIVGFDPDDAAIKFANSWGVQWGNNGFGRISSKDAQKVLGEMWAIDVLSR